MGEGENGTDKAGREKGTISGVSVWALLSFGARQFCVSGGVVTCFDLFLGSFQ